MDRTIDNLFRRLRSSALLTLIGINVGVWLLLRIASIVVFFATGADGETAVSRWVELPSALSLFPAHAYGLITYMFSQYGVLHLAFNMLWLYWFGRMLLEITSERSLTVLYVYGGLGGGLLFLAAFNLLPAFAGSHGWLIGSSASVLAIVTATAILMPDYPVYLFLLGMVRLKWIAIVTIVIVLMSVSGPNAGGEIAHVGGILVGVAYGVLRRRGVDITKFSRPRRPRRRPRHAAPRRREEDDREELDRILDKIKRSGYGGLTAEERRRLFEVSNRVK